ncbi:WD40 repeat-like protein [Periconia macrospinosa]|uniref:WD40 repeat-like protein n=1 Tax=Periconia macrospinosa TaxID=97972 RepID=A0A2V1D9B3_9PLEO|nr:WD40 repeat-like protein [Periconia macrospinosa]
MKYPAFQTPPLETSRNGSTHAHLQSTTAPTRSAAPSNPTVHTSPAALSVALSEEENHFLIYLKEVKKLKWGEITEAFNRYYPGRTYPKLQSTYSTKLNKRDRSKDPPIWTVPPSYDSEAASHSASPAVPVIPKQPKYHPAPAWQEPVTSVERSPIIEPRRERPRRAISVKDYTWATLGEPQFTEKEENDSLASKSIEPPESLQSAPEVAIPIDNPPLVPYSFEKEDALLAVSAHKKRAQSSREKLPYLSSSERFTLQNPPMNQEWDQLSSRDWQGSLVHVDFNPLELKIVQKAIYKVLNTPKEQQSRCDRKHLQRLLQDLPEPKFLRIQNEAHKQLRRNRDGKSVKAFLTDAQGGQFRTERPVIERLAAARPNREYSTAPKASITSMVSERELGLQSRRGWKAASQPVSYQLKNKIHDSLGPSFTYTGASSDVHAVAWSPDGQCFVAGAICVDDPHSMQYNKGNNLLYGDLTYGVIHELGGHSVPRPRTESGPNSTHAMFASQDPKLYKTVSSVVFSPDGRFVYSGGYDHKVCIWETRPEEDPPNFGQPKWSGAWRHKAPVDIMAINSSGLLATASKKPSTNAIKTIRMLDDDCQMIDRQNFSSQKATSKPNYNILPTALHFSPRYENLLLAGFGANVRLEKFDLSGDMCLWDVNRPKEPLNIIGSGRNVFDLAFHPRQNWFAAGCVASGNVNRGTQSVVRLHDEIDPSKYSMRVELECKALDMNDIAWCPGNDYLIAAGCTSGKVYVWDVRWPDDFLRELAHARSLIPLDDNLDREVTDTGVRFLSWGDNATRLYTGSSDGVVKVWNVTTSEEETFVKDLITTDSGIMSGSFSPDKSKLVLGDIDGSINVLEVGQDDCSLKEAKKFVFIPYDGKAEREDESDQVERQSNLEQSQEDTGVSAATELLKSGQMLQMPLGGLPIRQAVQGPNYAGPFDYSVDAPFLREQALQFQLDLARPAAPQCALPACKDAIVRVTSEEIGDSGRSLDRIADELRQAWKTPKSILMKSIPGKSRCHNCDGIARPSTSGDTFCERCSFACFRCCKPINVPPATDKLKCPHCMGVWEIGALGFESVHESRQRPNLDGIVPSLNNLTIDDGSSGEETDDYYFRQAVDRPESPPL